MNKFSKKQPVELIIVEEEPVLQTEDLGKKFEMAICLLYNIQYDGKYKYSIDDAHLLKNKLTNLLTLFPYQLKHTAKAGSQYDFTCITDDTIKLSAKTTKKDGKVCPQVIGQPSKKKFCNFFNVSIIDSEPLEQQIKNYIQTNIHKITDKIITDKTLNKAAHSYIEAQTAFAKVLLNNAMDITKVITENLSDKVMQKPKASKAD